MRILVLSLFLYGSLSFAAEKRDIQIIESAGEAVLGEDTTPAQARALALNNARRSAIEQASGAIVHGSTVVYNFQLISDLIASSSRGVIVQEEILSDDTRKEGKEIIYAVKIRAQVKTLENREKGNLKIVKATVGRYGSASAGATTVFQENDEMQIRAKVNADAYIHIFGIGQNGMVARIYPNEYFKGEMVSSQTEFIFPNERQRELGLKLKVRTPAGLSRGIETVLIAATKEKVDFLSDKTGGEITVTDLMKELSDVEPSLWTETTVGYEVRK
ncbi:MAG: DUF4384 domain-containing protein [Deltaproteobacteria bacterium]|nr:DUF4384 domain-containing protein [Deltaproteobacteria bacterium]